MAKWLAADAADQAMQTHGGFGYAKEHQVERYLAQGGGESPLLLPE